VADKHQVEGGGCLILNVPSPRVIGEPEADYQARIERERQELAKQAAPGTKLVDGDWPLNV
jgi:hypothetical protein